MSRRRALRAGANRGALQVRIDQTELDGEVDELDGGVDGQLFHDLGPVGFDGADAHTEHVGDLPGGVALGDELKDFALAVGQLVVALGARAALFGGKIGVDQDFRDLL